MVQGSVEDFLWNNKDRVKHMRYEQDRSPNWGRNMVFIVQALGGAKHMSKNNICLNKGL